MPFAVRHTVLGKLLAFLQNHIAKCLYRAFLGSQSARQIQARNREGVLAISFYVQLRGGELI